jgi:hypothetical protein
MAGERNPHSFHPQGDLQMKYRLVKYALLSMFVYATFSCVSYGQNDKQKPDSYSGVAIGTGGTAGGKTLGFNFNISAYTTDDEVQSYATLLKEKGQDALLNLLQKQDKGRFNPTGSVGTQIAIARKRQLGTETIITIVTARPMSFAELYRSGRSVSYPFGYMQVKINDKGIGTGQIMAAAKLRFDKKSGQYEIESFGNQYIKATNVRQWK